VSAVRLAGADDAAAIAALHVARIGEGFLATLGPGFLRRLYARMARTQDAFVVVADDARDVVGFCAVAEDTRRLYRSFIVRDGVPASVAALPSIARAPRRTWETLRYGTRASGEHELPSAEILAVAVAGSHAGQGLGGALVERALEELRARHIGGARVVTGATNEPALRMYRRAGFVPHTQTEVHRGVPQEVLVWHS
jgi:ribosomal protein S18 acetylase RimI-like enzyme